MFVECAVPGECRGPEGELCWGPPSRTPTQQHGGLLPKLVVPQLPGPGWQASDDTQVAKASMLAVGHCMRDCVCSANCDCFKPGIQPCGTVGSGLLWKYFDNSGRRLHIATQVDFSKGRKSGLLEACKHYMSWRLLPRHTMLIAAAACMYTTHVC